MAKKCEMHLITGGKGGVGKTLVSLCLATRLLHQHQSAVIVDLSFFNQDLFFILKRLGSPNRIRQENEFIIIELINRSLLVAPNFEITSHYQLPDGIGGFYRCLNKIFSLQTIRDYNPDICLVDTGFHIANLALPREKASVNSWLGNGENYLTNKYLNIWFLWTLGALERPEERLAIADSLRQIPHINVGFFDDRKNLHHVFNTFSLYERSPLESFLRLFLFHGQEPLRKLAKSSQGDSVSYKLILKDVVDAINTGKNPSTGEIDYRKIVSAIGEEIMKLTQDKRPSNIYPLFSNSNLKNYISRLTYDTPMTLDTLTEFLGSTYILMNKYQG